MDSAKERETDSDRDGDKSLGSSPGKRFASVPPYSPASLHELRVNGKYISYAAPPLHTFDVPVPTFPRIEG